MAADQTPKVVPVTTVEELPNSFQHGAGINPVNLNLHPGLEPAFRRTAEMLQKLLLSTDGAEPPVHFVLNDSMIPNAAFYRDRLDNPTVRMVVLNLGTFTAVQNDAELSAVLAHELQHGDSKIEDVINRLRESRNQLDQLKANGLHKALESEVDVRAILERVIPAGYNPHAMYELWRRWSLRLGNNFGQSHPMNRTRKDNIALALAWWVRERGETTVDRHGDLAKPTEIFDRVKRVFDSAGFQKSRENAANELISGAAARENRQSIAANNFQKYLDTRSAPEGLTNFTDTILYPELSRLANILGDQIDPDELVVWQLKLQAAALEDIATAQAEVISAESHRFADLADFIRFDSMNLTVPSSTFGPPENIWVKLDEARQELAQQKLRLNNLLIPPSEAALAAMPKQDANQVRQRYEKVDETIIAAARERILLQESEVSQLEAALKDAERIFTSDSATPERLQRYYAHRMGRSGDKILGPTDFGLVYRSGQNTFVAAHEARKRIFRAGAETILAASRGSDELARLANLLHRFDQMNLLPQSIEQFISALEGELGSTDPKIRKEALSNLFADPLVSRIGYRNLFTHLFYIRNLDPELARKLFDRWFEVVEKNIQTPVELEEFARELRSAQILEGEESLGALSDLGFPLGKYWSRIRTKAGSLINDLLKGTTAESASVLGSPHLLFEWIDSYRSTLERFREGTGELLSSSVSSRLLDRAVNIGVEAINMRVAESSSYSEKELALILQIRFPELFSNARPLTADGNRFAPPPTNAEIVEMIRSIALKDRAAEQFDIPRRGRDRSQNIKFNLYALMQRLYDPGNPEEFFDLIYYSEGIIDFTQKPTKLANSPEALAMRQSFAGWLVRHRQGQHRLRLLNALMRFDDERSGIRNPNFNATQVEFYRERLQYSFDITRATSSLTEQEAWAKVSENYWREHHAAGLYPWATPGYGRSGDLDTHHFGYPLMRALAPEDAGARLRFYHGFILGIKRWARNPNTDVDLNRSTVLMRFPTEEYLAYIDDPKTLREAPIADLVVAFLLLDDTDGMRRSLRHDVLFEAIWERRAEDTAAFARLNSPELVQKLSYVENMQRLANWQLENRFKISTLLRRSTNPTELDDSVTDAISRGDDRNRILLDTHQIRSDVPAIIDFIKRQFPNSGPGRDAVINDTEIIIQSSLAESDAFAKLRTGSENLAESNLLLGIDLPQVLDNHVKTHAERMQLIEYLLNDEVEPPHFPSSRLAGRETETFMILKRNFLQGDRNSQIYILMPLLDEDSGLFADSARREELFRRIMGDWYDHPVVSKLFFAYLDATPVGERRAIVAGVLAEMARGGANSKVNLRMILSAMGPLGIKAGQFLRTSGVLTKAQREELRDFFDAALKPERHEIMANLRRIFGKYIEQGELFVREVRELVGSGSINFAVRLTMQDPLGSGGYRDVVVRIRRENVAGRIREENSIWRRVYETLRDDSDPAVRRTANLLEEARAQAWSTLGENGVEFNLELERQKAPIAKGAYASAAVDAASELSIEVLEPIEELQHPFVSKNLLTYFKNLPILVDDGGANQAASIYPYVSHTSLENIFPLARREAIAAQIIRAEMAAMLEKGVFDPDPHPGNWLIDLENNRLVRIDYATITDNVPPVDRTAFRDSIAALLDPLKTKGSAANMATAINQLFTFPDGDVPFDLETVIHQAMLDPKMPTYDNPTDRLFHLQLFLEKHYQGLGRKDFYLNLKPNMRTMFSSLAKLNEYREHMSGNAFNNLLLEVLGISKSRLATRVIASRVSDRAQSTVRRVREGLTSLLGTDCARGFAGLSSNR